MSTGLRQVWNQNAAPTDHDAAQAALRQQWGNENIFTSNLVSGLKGYGGSSALGAANLAEVVGADAAAQGLRRKASSLLMDAQQAGTHHAEIGSVNSLGTLWDSAKANMAQGLGSMAPIIAAAPLGIAPGVLAATAPMYGENIARLERDTTLADMTPGEKALHAAPTAAVQGAMNYLVPGGVAANMGRRFAAKTGTGAAGKAGVTLGTVMGVEGATEAGEEYARQAMHTAANPERDKSKDAQELIQAGYSGALGGSPIGAMQAAGGYVRDTLDASAQDTRTLAQKAGDAIADAGGALGKRAGEREGAQIDEALNSLEREAKERGISPREVLAERVEALNKPVDLTAARTEAEAAEIVTADHQNKQAMTDQLAEDILMDPEASPAERSVAEAHIAGRQAGAENKHEETALNLNEINEQRDGIMGLVDTIAKAIEPIAGKPAPKNRGSAMKPEKLPYTDAELYRHSQLYDISADLRTLPLTELSRLDKTIERFAQGEFGPEVRKTLDKIFGTPEATEAVLELYKPGTSGTRGQEYDPNGGVTGADRTVLSEDEGSVIEATDQEKATELPTDTSTKWGSGSFKLGENSYFDTKDAAQAERLGKTVSALGKETAGARPTVKKIGMVDAELERRFGDDVSPAQKRALQVEITNGFFPAMQVMEETPANFDQMNKLAQADYKKRFEGFQRELDRRVRATNNRFQTAKAVSEATKGGGLDYNHDDIKSLALNMGSAGIANPKASPTNGTLLFERSDAKSPLITSAPQLLRRAFQIGPDREQTGDDTGAIEDLFNLLNMSTASVLDYSKRGENAEREFGERQARGEVTEYDVAPDAPKMRFTGRIGYVKYGKEVWVDKLQDLPDNFKLLERGGRRYTVGDLKDALAKKNADTAVEASVVRSRLEKMVKEGRFNSLEKTERAKITQAITAHKKNPQNAVAAGALNALYAKHVGAVYKDGAPEERGVKTRTLEDGTVEYLDDSEKYDPNAGKVASEVEDTQDSSGSPLELGQRKYDVPNQPIQRGADGTTSSNPGYNVIGAAQPRGANAPRSEPNRPDRVQPTSTEEITDTAEIFDDETGQLKTKRRTDDFGNAVTSREVPVAEKKVQRSVPDDGFGNRVASTTVKAGRSSAPTTAQDKSRNEDRMDPGTKPLPESARALYKTESPGEWVASVLAPRGGVEAALKAWSTVKNATTEKMQRSKMLFARALHTIADMQPESFRLEFNKKLTAQQSQTMIDRAKSVIEQGKVPDDRPRDVDKGAAESRPLGESRQDDNGGARQARDADARVVPGAATNTGPVAQELQRPDTGAVARGAETEVAPESSETKRSDMNAQAPNNTADATKRAADLKKAIEEVKRLLGADFDAKAVNALFDPVTNTEWSGEFSPAEMKILIAAGATDAVGTGRHEALHALFKMLKDMGHPQATKVIENLATNPIIMRKLKVLLADEKAALEQLKDPEEAAAYLFQFWMAGQIELGPQAKTFFQQVMKWLDDIQLMLREKVFGSKAATNEREQRRQNELAETLLAHFRDGAMAAPEGRARVQAVLEKNAKAVEARRLNTRAFGHKFHKFMEKGIYSAASIFEDSANPHVKEIGRMFFRLEGDVKGQNQNFIEAAGQWNDKYQVELRNILTSIDNETMGLVSKYMNDRTPLDKIHHPEAKAAVTKLRELLKQLYLYQKGRNTARWDEATNSWQLLGEIKENYYPRVWSIGALTDKQGEFLEKMTKALEKYRRDHKGFPDIEEFDAAKVAQGILNKLINGNGNNGPQETESDIGITPWQASVNKRDLNWLDDVAPGEFTDFLSQDVSEVMTSYIAQATKRAEYSKAFGRGGENLRNKVHEAIAHEMNPELMDKAKAKLVDMLEAHEKGTPPNLVSAMRAVMRTEKVPEAEVDKVHADAVARLEPVTKAIMAMEGTLGREIDPNLRHVMSGVTTFQNFRLLPLALFASINDVVGMVARGGSMKDSFQAFARGVREVGMMWKGTYSNDELAKLAESLGTVGAGNYLDSMGQTYSSQFMYGKLRRWNDKLFKWNGLEAWNRAVRIQATGVAIEFIKRHVEKPNEHSKRYLEELFGKDYDTSQIMKNGDLDYSSDAVQQAILSWVNGAVLRPNAAHRPVFASDPHYMLFYHLKQFAYSFHKVILRRTWVEAKEGNYTPAAALFVGYVPVSIAADVMKELLIVGDDDPWWTKGGLTDYLEHGIARANLGGVPQMWLGDTMADPLKIFNNPEGVASRASNVLGPAPDQLIDLLTVPMFDNKSLSRELAGGVPGGVLLRRYID